MSDKNIIKVVERDKFLSLFGSKIPTLGNARYKFITINNEHGIVLNLDTSFIEAGVSIDDKSEIPKLSESEEARLNDMLYHKFNKDSSFEEDWWADDDDDEPETELSWADKTANAEGDLLKLNLRSKASMVLALMIILGVVALTIIIIFIFTP